MTIEIAVLGIAIGLVLALVCYLTTNLSPGGMITPGWLAMTLFEDYTRLLLILGVVVMTYFLMTRVKKVVILYGKRLFAAVVLLGAFIQMMIFLLPFANHTLLSTQDMLSFIVPGLIAYQLTRQPIAATLLSTASVTILTSGVLLVALHLVPAVDDREGSAFGSGGGAEQREQLPVEQGNLSTLVSDVVDAIPDRGSDNYQEPSPEEVASFAVLASAMGDGDVALAKRLADVLDYTLVFYDDAETGRRLLVAREEASPASTPDRGWGTIVVDPEGADSVVEVSHPISDMYTSEVGTELFQKMGARALLVAGAHRYDSDEESDVAHEPGSAFDAAHVALLPAQYVIQPHGFDSGYRSDFPDVVLSAGSLPPPKVFEDMREDLQDAEIETKLFDGDSRFEDLAGTTNLQGNSTLKTGGYFVHLELSEDARMDPSERSDLVEALAEGASN